MGKEVQAMAVECTGVEIQMPWGHISGKWWGPQTGRPVLALHGWQDNAGTFDTLIPLLPAHIGYLAVDLPGHGLSSRFPNGLMNSITDYVYVVCMIMKEYNWEKVSILGHSMGAIIGFLLAGIYPEKVDFLIGLDGYKPMTILQRDYGPNMKYLMSGFLTADERNRNENEPPSYTYDECVEKLYLGTRSSVYREKCPYILNRNIRKSGKYPDKYYFARDSRLKYADMGVWPQEMYAKLLSHIKCSTLLIRALESFVPDLESFNRDLAVLKNNPRFEYKEVDGSHHVHLNEPHKSTEIEIKVPWGHISGKWWGPHTKQPFLALHGWQDNAGTFDTLIPLLPSDLSVLAIDLPGHGLSSRIPDGLNYHNIDYLYVVCMLMKEYNWDKVSIIGHSMGAILGILMAGIFPDKVDILIALDSYKPTSYMEKHFGLAMNHTIRSFLIADERNRSGDEPPSCTYDECVEKLYIGAGSSIDRDKCPYILNRNIKKSTKYPDRYYFARDSRLKHINESVWPEQMYAKFLTRVVCPTLYIRALDSSYDIENFETNMNVLRKNPDFEYHTVEGRHHVHLNDPHKVSGIINNFLFKHTLSSKAKL